MTKLVNRAKMTTASTGTGSPITLGSAVDGYQTFAAAGVADADVVRYTIEDGSAWEVGTGTYTATGTTLSRTLVESSTGSLLNLSGNAVVYVIAAAQDIQQPPAEGAFVDGDKTKLDAAVQPNDNVTLGTVEANAPSGNPAMKGYFGLKATTATQTISSMTLSTLGMGDATGGTLSNGDWVLLITSYNFYQKTYTPAVAINGTVQTVTSLNSAPVLDYFDTELRIEKFQVSGTPTSIEFGVDNAGTLEAPAAGTNSADESAIGIMIVFADEPSIANITDTALANGATMTGETLSSTTGAWTFSVLGGYSSSTASYTNPTATNTYDDGNSTSFPQKFYVAFGYEESITTQDITGQSSLNGLIRTTFTWTQAGAGSGAAVTANGDISVTGTVDGRDIAADGAKLDGIEAGATADQTAAEIKTAYESNANTNAFTDAEQTKLAGIEAGADVTDAGNVNPLVDAHLNTSSATTGQYLGWNGADYAWSTVSGYTDADVDTHLNTGTATTGEVLSWTGTDYDWVAVSGGATDINGLSDGYSDGSSVGLGSGALSNDDGTTNQAVALGVNALTSIANGLGNVAIGSNALTASTSGTNAVVIGRAAFDGATAHAGMNIAIGYSAVGTTTSVTGDENVAVGPFAGSNLTSSTRSTILGPRSGGNITSGSQSIAIGMQALSGGVSGLSGTDNIGIGYQTGYDLTTGTYNFLGGYRAGSNLTTGSGNVAIGRDALYFSATTVTDNVSIGTYAGGGSTSIYGVNIGGDAGYWSQGAYNIGIGYQALRGDPTSKLTGARNVGIGDSVGIDLTTGANNFLGGYQAGTNLTTGSDNVAIGKGANDIGTTNSNTIVIGNGADPSSATVSNEITLGNSSITTLRCQVTTITSLSDARDKTDVQPLNAGLDFVNALEPVSFTWNMRDGGKVGEADTGFIAQDLQKAQADTGVSIPGLVYDVNPDKLEAGYGKLVPVLVQAIKDLSAKVDELEARLEGK